MTCGTQNSTKLKMSDIVRPLADVVKEVYDEATEADWEGRPSEHLWKRYAMLRERSRNGELYEVMF